jgi:hypothetical protein
MKIKIAICDSYGNSMLAFHLDGTKYYEDYKKLIESLENPTMADILINDAQFIESNSTTYDSENINELIKYSENNKEIIKIDADTYIVPTGKLNSSSIFLINEVDTTKPWRVDEYDGKQTIIYLKIEDTRYNMYS